MIEFKCKDCGKLLGYVEGVAEVKCPRCHSMNRIETQQGEKPKEKKLERPERR